jgi:hypothetical protein
MVEQVELEDQVVFVKTLEMPVNLPVFHRSLLSVEAVDIKVVLQMGVPVSEALLRMDWLLRLAEMVLEIVLAVKMVAAAVEILRLVGVLTQPLLFPHLLVQV